MQFIQIFKFCIYLFIENNHIYHKLIVIACISNIFSGIINATCTKCVHTNMHGRMNELTRAIVMLFVYIELFLGLFFSAYACLLLCFSIQLTTKSLTIVMFMIFCNEFIDKRAVYAIPCAVAKMEWSSVNNLCNKIFTLQNVFFASDYLIDLLFENVIHIQCILHRKQVLPFGIFPL